MTQRLKFSLYIVFFFFFFFLLHFVISISGEAFNLFFWCLFLLFLSIGIPFRVRQRKCNNHDNNEHECYIQYVSVNSIRLTPSMQLIDKYCFFSESHFSLDLVYQCRNISILIVFFSSITLWIILLSLLKISLMH